MGEARRRRRGAHETLDGGPPSDHRIALMLEIFDPVREVMLGGDPHYLAAICEMLVRMLRRPTPICGGCDYEFGVGEAPPLMFCTRPYIAKAEAYQLLSGVICPRCAALPTDALLQRLMGYLRKIKPDAALVEEGHA